MNQIFARGSSFDLSELLKSPLTVAEKVQAYIEIFGLDVTAEVQDGLSETFKRQQVRFNAWQREAERNRGVCLAGAGPGPFNFATAEQILAEAREHATSRTAYLNSPAGKARRAIAKACAIAHEQGSMAVYGAFDAVSCALSRGDGAVERFALEAQTVVAGLADSEAKTDLQLLATELVVIASTVEAPATQHAAE